MNRKIYILGSGLNMDPDGGIYPNLNSNGTDCRTNPHPVKTIGRFFPCTCHSLRQLLCSLEFSCVVLAPSDPLALYPSNPFMWFAKLLYFV